MTYRQISLLLVASCIVLNVAFDGALGWALHLSRAQYEKSAEVNVANLSKMLEQNISSFFSEINITLLNVMQEGADLHVVSNPEHHTFNAFLEEQKKRIPNIQGLRVADTKGNIVYASGNVQNSNVNVEDREHFQRVRDLPDAGLVITGPIQGRVSGKWLLIASRRITKPDGSFGGEVHASVAVDTIIQIFKSLDLGPHGVVSMWDKTSTVIRFPEFVGEVNTIGTKKPSPQLKALLDSDTKEALYHAKAPTDNVLKSYSIRKIGLYPLWIIVGVAENDYLSHWWDEVHKMLAIALLFAVCTVSITWYIFRYWQMGRRISESENLFATLAQHAPMGIIQTDAAGACIYVNNKWSKLTGLTDQQAKGSGWMSALHPDDRDKVVNEWHDVMRTNRDFSLEYRFVTPSGEIHWVSGIAVPLTVDFDDSPRYIGCVADITDRKKIEMSLQVSEELFRTLCNSAPIGIFRADCDGSITYMNPHCEKISGFSVNEMLGHGWQKAVHPDDREIKVKIWFEAVAARQHCSQEYQLVTPQGDKVLILTQANPIMDHVGNCIGYVGIVEDITERVQYEEQLAYQANHDALTGLLNRNLLADRITQLLANAHRYNQLGAVLFIDLDNFKFVNDSLGHDLGDRLLKVEAERLYSCTRSCDTVARYGGDEFVIVISMMDKGEDAATVAEHILEVVSRPFTIDGHDFGISCSIGISIFPKDGSDADTLLKNADTAMYRAKEQGRNTFQFYTRELHDRVVERMTMERHLRRALEREELTLYYQPQVELHTGRIVGVEALLRWCNPDLGLVPPAKFIDVAEETGLIVPIGEWVLKTCCEQNKAWQDAGLPRLVISVNISGRQLQKKGLVGFISRILQETGLEPRYLELEIVENMVMQDMERTAVTLKELKGLGVPLAMDDFGTGVSSLSNLKLFPFDKLKIDISFIRDITTDSESAAISRSIIAMAHNLRLSVIAEGVETKEQFEYLRLLGCDAIQGFYFCHPLPAQEIEQIIHEGRRLPVPA